LIQHSQTYLGKEEYLALYHLLDNGLLTSGKECEAFQKEFRNYIGAEYAHVTSSGTMAFYVILLALDVSLGDEILVPDYICKDVIGPILALGAIPVLYDNKYESWIASSNEIKAKVNGRTKVILVNHTFGFIFKEIEKLADEIASDIFIVEDCCHAIISKNSDYAKFTLKHSHCAFYSFNATKLLASGEGGAICTNNALIAKSLEKIKIGDRLSDINCAIARVQLKKLDYFLEKRSQIADRYLSAFSSLRVAQSDLSGLNFRFPMLVKNNSGFWKSDKVAYRKGVDSLVSDWLGYTHQPQAFTVLEETVSIPIYPTLEPSQVNLIVDETHKLLLECI
jgi:dTDP-4-amino-4,6-dideoxygalactose transaminase